MNQKTFFFILGAALTLSLGACTEDANMHNIGNSVTARERIKENHRYQETGTLRDEQKAKEEAKGGNPAQKEKDAE